MLSDEEKKAYDNLIMLKYFTMEKEDKQAIDTILNLIEKQSNEIEEYNTKLLSNAGIYQLGFNDGEKSVEAKIEELKKYKKYYEEMEEVNKKFIPVDKIKAKIEELKQKKYILSSRESEIEILQSLLEEEE